MKRRRGWPPGGRLCATCCRVMTGRSPEVLTCSQTCSFAWLRNRLKLVPHSRTGEPFIVGLTSAEAHELCLLNELVDNHRLRTLHQKHLVAMASGDPEVKAFAERSALAGDNVH